MKNFINVTLRENPQIGYINNLKSYWDEIQQDLCNATSKNLRDQASRV